MGFYVYSIRTESVRRSKAPDGEVRGVAWLLVLISVGEASSECWDIIVVPFVVQLPCGLLFVYVTIFLWSLQHRWAMTPLFLIYCVRPTRTVEVTTI